ncbi:hypothetical protein JCM8547_007614 [Rhodosporidiobolus lusitaniae]
MTYYPPPPSAPAYDADPRPLPPGWVREVDAQTGAPYFVDTTAFKLQAVWEDPRPAFYAARGSLPAGPPPQQNQYAPPPAPAYGRPPQPPQHFQQPPPPQAYPAQQQPVQEYQQQMTAQGGQERGFLSKLVGGGTGQGSSGWSNKNTLLAGAGGLVAGGLAYKLFEEVTDHHHDHHHHHHGSGGPGGWGDGPGGPGMGPPGW